MQNFMPQGGFHDERKAHDILAQECVSGHGISRRKKIFHDGKSFERKRQQQFFIQLDIFLGVVQIVARQGLILGKKIGRQFDVVKAFPRNTKAVAGNEIDAIERMIQLKGKGHSAEFFGGVDFVGLRDSNEAAFPRGFVAVSEADKIDTSEELGGVTFAFELDHPLDGINLVASDRFRITRERFHNIELSAYFFAEDQALARNYLDYAKKYIQLYEELLLPFPFKRFAIVENFLPTGYSMPTYTLLGQDVVRLPFIVETSLGHEILHQWFGNQVFPGEKGGNWTEGLTTYLADHLYEERKQEGWAYRKQILIDYASYVRDDGFPLK